MKFFQRITVIFMLIGIAGACLISQQVPRLESARR